MRAKEFARHIFEQVKSNWYIPVTEHQVYSTAEQKIGVWTDGKPLYRRAITGTSPSSNGDFSTGLTGIENVTISRTIIKNDSGYNVNISFADQVGVDVKQDGSVIYFRYPADTSRFKGQPFTIFLEYTKTTDTATSPKVPYEPLHEWSTEEKLVGYWINGQAVYEKTVDCGALPNNVLKSVPHGITNIDKTISMAGFAMQKNGSNKYSIPIPFTSGYGGTGIEAMLQVNDVNIRIKTNGDLSSYDESYVTLRYTKTT